MSLPDWVILCGRAAQRAIGFDRPEHEVVVMHGASFRQLTTRLKALPWPHPTMACRPTSWLGDRVKTSWRKPEPGPFARLRDPQVASTTASTTIIDDTVSIGTSSNHTLSRSQHAYSPRSRLTATGSYQNCVVARLAAREPCGVHDSWRAGFRAGNGRCSRTTRLFAGAGKTCSSLTRMAQYSCLQPPGRAPATGAPPAQMRCPRRLRPATGEAGS